MSVIITQSKVNLLQLATVDGNVTSVSVYLLEFVNKTTSNKYYCVAVNKSNTIRYVAFCITETFSSSGGTNPYASQVALALSGQYYLNVYENPNSLLSPSTLNQVATTFALVINPAPVVTPSYQSAVNPNLQVYNPELNS